MASVTPRLNELLIFALDEDGIISELHYKPDAWVPLTSIGNAQAHPSSPVAAVLNGSAVQLYWINPQGQLQSAIRSDSWSDGMSSLSLSRGS